MNNLTKCAAVIATVFVFGTPAISGDPTPVGQWQTVTGESRYEVSPCGGGGQLCAKLTWLRTDARTAQNLQYLNKYVVTGARRTGANRWKGAVRYNGDEFGGSMILVNPEKLRLNGCKAMFCQSVEFVRL